MARGAGLFSKVKGRVERTARKQLNKIADAVQEFDDRGGARGAYERARVRTERQAARLVDLLEERGIEFDFSRFVPPTNEEEAAIRGHYRTLGVPYGAGLDEVKSAYRRHMREHHPDKHADDPQREKEATRISQDLSIAYDALEARLRPRR